MAVLKWKPIEDLPDRWRELASPELEAIAAIWRDQSARLSNGNAFARFNERLAREWAIETGILERIYTLDRGITQILIEKGLEASLIPHGCSDRPAEEVVMILKDHRQALEGLFAFVYSQRELSNSYIKELHQMMTRNQETVTAINGLGRKVETSLLRGQWKKLPNNPYRLLDGEQVHEYCPPEHVDAEMDRLITIHQRHVQDEIPPEVEAAWLHHRFTQIHPFQDGNGRIARALASMVLIRSGWFPLVVNRDQREEYIRACETADDGDLRPLIDLFTRIQKKAFVRALSISEDVLSEREAYQQVIAAAGERLRARDETKDRDQAAVFFVSVDLENATNDKLFEVAKELNQQFSRIGKDYRATVGRKSDSTKLWFLPQIQKLSEETEYYADTRTYNDWLRLHIREERQASLVISFHVLGREFLGIMAASAFMVYHNSSDGQGVGEAVPHQVCEEIFQFSYNEKPDKVLKRFQEWLDQSVVMGLYHWRKQL
jgi:Fic family protein